MEYVYHKHVGLGTEDQPVVRVTLDARQSRTFNQAHLVRVKKTGAHRVKATLDGVLINPVTIDPGGQDPPIGFYADLPFKPPPTLKQLECLAQASPRGTALLGLTFRVTQGRGQELHTDIARFTFATVHPAAVLRAPDDVQRRIAREEFIPDFEVVGDYFKKL